MNISVAEMKANLSEVLRKAAAGEEITVTKHGKMLVTLTPKTEPDTALPKVGAFAGKYVLPDNWDDIPTGFEKYE